MFIWIHEHLSTLSRYSRRQRGQGWLVSIADCRWKGWGCSSNFDTPPFSYRRWKTGRAELRKTRATTARRPFPLRLWITNGSGRDTMENNWNAQRLESCKTNRLSSLVVLVCLLPPTPNVHLISTALKAFQINCSIEPSIDHFQRSSWHPNQLLNQFGSLGKLGIFQNSEDAKQLSAAQSSF